MTKEEAKKIIEALLFVSERPLIVDKISEVLESFDNKGVRTLIDELNIEYAKTDRCFSIVEVAGGLQLMTDPLYAPWIRKLFTKSRKQRLSTPSLETLAIISYKQPITKAEVESIRGVNIDGVMDTLLARDLIRMVGRKDVVGRPFLYGTTKNFLGHFGLNSLEDLPNLREFTEDEIELGRDELIKKESEGTDEEKVEEPKEVTQKD
ncbi:MAG: SMC-Scp complex subunit ScpB [Candidatus Omnitrophica bacterium]|nr:SMC-Scp complex subunit ScpB [Candidatus Omnitrophota bacterium]